MWGIADPILGPTCGDEKSIVVIFWITRVCKDYFATLFQKFWQRVSILVFAAVTNERAIDLIVHCQISSIQL